MCHDEIVTETCENHPSPTQRCSAVGQAASHKCQELPRNQQDLNAQLQQAQLSTLEITNTPDPCPTKLVVMKVEMEGQNSINCYPWRTDFVFQPIFPQIIVSDQFSSEFCEPKW